MNLPRMRNSQNVWGRGTGKSSGISWLMNHILETMPRSTWAIQGASFQQLLTRTLPGTFEFMERQGFENGIDYFINRQPPKGIDLPYYRPLKYDNYITLVHPSGYSVGFTLMSQDRSSSRGANVDGIICDESLLLDVDEFNKQATFTNRGHDEYFKKNPIHHGVFHFSSMPVGDSWLFRNEDYYIKDGFDLTSLRNKIIDLQMVFVQNRDKKDRLEIYREMLPLMDKMRFYVSKTGKYYSEWNIFDNIENLGLRYIDDMYDTTTEHIFLVEGLNKRVQKIVDGFYPTLNRDVHGYKGRFDYNHLDNLEFDFEKLSSLDSRQDEDCNPNIALEIGLDFGTAINWLVVGQEDLKANRFDFIKNFYVKSPKIIDHLANEFIEYYRFHKKKLVYIYPDAQGNWKQPNKDETFVETIIRLLRQAGWQTVVVNNKTYNKEQHDTYLLWARLLAGNESAYPTIGFNLINCKELVYSMEQTPAYDHDGRIKKNKQSEKKLTTNREAATDAGDAADQIIYYKYRRLLNYTRSRLPLMLGN
jgi:hypothetical protein